ncbi:MAG: penicillin acylase family protein, partial [Chitinophagaceae bacterium]
RDYYEIKFKDESKKQYWFNGEWRDTKIRIESIRIKNESVVYDTVAYTVFGPVMYDQSFMAETLKGKNLAVRWKGHDPSNEALAFYLLNHARNYNEYLEAIKHFHTPGQNFIFASKTGDIAIWQQGEFPARWDRQGLYVMPGHDSSYMWQGIIPQEENPHSINPERGYLSSANQRPVEGTYPYFIPGGYDLYRGITIHRALENMQGITVDDMKTLLSNNHNEFAATARPLFQKYIAKENFSTTEKKYFDLFENWNLQNGYDEAGATIFTMWYDTLESRVWDDEIGKLKEIGFYPSERTLLELLLRDTALSYVDNIHTEAKENISDVLFASFKACVPTFEQLEKEGKLIWGKFKNTTVYHLLKTLKPFARAGLPIGGGRHIVNATQHNHGPSWRMVVHLTDETEAWVVYPGGQSGNPGSRYFDQFVDTWANGSFYRVWFYKKGDESHPRKRWTMTFSKG